MAKLIGSIKIKDLLKLYKQTNPSFNYEYDGEIWTARWYRNEGGWGEPDFKGDTDSFKSILFQKLDNEYQRLKSEGNKILDKANEIERALY